MDFFSRRTAIERNILSLVNTPGLFDTELQGLSLVAIDKWQNELHKHHPALAVDGISTSLKALATGIHTAVNISDEVFLEPDHVLLEGEIEHLSKLIYDLAK